MRSLYVFTGMGIAVVGAGMYIFARDWLNFTQHHASRQPQPWDIP